MDMTCNSVSYAVTHPPEERSWIRRLADPLRYIPLGTNCLGHAHFTLLLIPELVAGAKSSSDGKARVINTSSSAAYYAGPVGIDFDALLNTPKRTSLGHARLYAQSKYVSDLYSFNLTPWYKARQLTAPSACVVHRATSCSPTSSLSGMRTKASFRMP